MNEGTLHLGMASLADTGQWRMVVEISDRGMTALLKNVDYKETPTVTLFSRLWDEESCSDLLSALETAVYDNPRMLEDFATQVVVTTPAALWIPEEYTDDEDFDESLFTDIYKADRADISADFSGGEVCLYTFLPGLNSFLNRTLPGCRIVSHHSVLKSFFENSERSASESGPETDTSSRTLYVNIREARGGTRTMSDVDIYLFEEGHLLCGATHEWKTPSDLCYWTLLATHAYGFVPDECRLILASDADDRKVAGSLAEYFPDMRRLVREGNSCSVCSLAAGIAAGDEIKIIAHEDNKREIRQEKV